MSNLQSNKYANGKIYVGVTNEKPYFGAVRLSDFGASEFAERAFKDLQESVDGKHRTFHPTQKGVYQLIYKLGMYGTILIRFNNEEIAKEVLADNKNKLYLMCAMCFAIENLVFPIIESKE